jgi:acyl-CoA thioester hydrolase
VLFADPLVWRAIPPSGIVAVHKVQLLIAAGGLAWARRKSPLLVPEVRSMDATKPEAPRPLDAARSVARVRVRFGETDLMGIVHHASYASYMEVGRVEWLRRRGATYASWAERGIHLPVIELSILYRAPARFDDELAVETSIADVRAASLRFAYRIARESDAMLCAEGSTRLACVDGRGAVRRLSDEMLQALHRAELTV